MPLAAKSFIFRISPRLSRNSSLSRRAGGFGCLKWAHRERTTHQEPQMITAFFVFVTVAFFAAITANVAASLSGNG